MSLEEVKEHEMDQEIEEKVMEIQNNDREELIANRRREMFKLSINEEHNEELVEYLRDQTISTCIAITSFIYLGITVAEHIFDFLEDSDLKTLTLIFSIVTILDIFLQVYYLQRIKEILKIDQIEEEESECLESFMGVFFSTILLPFCFFWFLMFEVKKSSEDLKRNLQYFCLHVILILIVAFKFWLNATYWISYQDSSSSNDSNDDDDSTDHSILKTLAFGLPIYFFFYFFLHAITIKFYFNLVRRIRHNNLDYTDDSLPQEERKLAIEDNKKIKEISDCYLQVFPFFSGLSFGVNFTIFVIEPSFGIDLVPRFFLILAYLGYLILIFISLIYLYVDISNLTENRDMNVEKNTKSTSFSAERASEAANNIKMFSENEAMYHQEERKSSEDDNYEERKFRITQNNAMRNQNETKYIPGHSTML